MVEQVEHSGLWPTLDGPFCRMGRGLGHQIAGWLNPPTEASGGDGAKARAPDER